MLEVRRLHDRGEYDEAEQKYRALLEEADDPSDRRYVRLQLARLAADREDFSEALERYRAIWREAESGAIPARAMFEASELLVEDLDDPERARGLRRRLVRRYPGSSWAERAVESLARDYREREAWEELERAFESMHDEAAETPVADDILFTLAIVLKRDAGRPGRALPHFERILERHPDADLVDDAEWEAAQIYVDRQDWDRATDLLQRTAQRVDNSWLIGTFNSPHASKARYRLGFIHLTHLDDYRVAIDHFRTYLNDFPNNRRADDSAWHIAQAYRLMDERERYLEALRRLVEEYPESRYVERARERLAPPEAP